LAFLKPDLPLFRLTHQGAQWWQTPTSRLLPHTDICQPLTTCSTDSAQSSPATSHLELEKQQRLPKKNLNSENFLNHRIVLQLIM